MDGLLDEDEDCREVYARAGLALYTAQVWERAMVNLALVTRAIGGRYAQIADWDSDEEALTSLTAGSLRSRLLADGLVPVTMLQGWDSTLAARNYLAHRFFWEHALTFATTNGRQRMIAELDAMREQFGVSNDEATVLAKQVAQTWGVGPEDYERAIAALVEDARRRDLGD